MRRCALPPPLTDDRIPLSSDAKRYLSGSLRLKLGDQFIGFDQEGNERIFSLVDEDGSLQAEAVGDVYRGRCGVPIALCFALPKGDKLDLVARQITELGIGKLTLWEAERSIGVWRANKIEQKLARLARVTREAARQSGRADHLLISKPTPLNELITQYQTTPLKLFFDPEAEDGWPKISSDDELRSSTSETICAILVGPEGGLSPKECAQLQNAGWHGVRLTTPILRTETAGVVAASLALDRLGWLT